jgi:hypothetical protein
MTHAKGRLVASHTASDDGHRPVMGRIAVVVVIVVFCERGRVAFGEIVPVTSSNLEYHHSPDVDFQSYM